MKYQLLVPVFSKDIKPIDLTFEEFEKINEYTKFLFKILEIEEKYNFILHSYLEFEKNLLDLAAKSMVFLQHEWSTNIADMLLVNVELLSLLSVTKMYLDQTPSALNKIFGANSQQFQNFKKSTSNEYDQYLEYRVIYQMRNFIQHNSLPISRSSRGGKFDAKSDNPLTAYTYKIYVDLKKLEADKDFKLIVLNELKLKGDSFELAPYIRIFIECLTRVHSSLRAEIKSSVDEKINYINGLVSQYKSINGEKIAGLEAILINDDGARVDASKGFVNIIERLKHLYIKNRAPILISSSVISTS